MKFFKLLPLMLAAALLFTSCKSASTAELVKMVTRADVTHSDDKERIVTCITGAETGDAYVKIFTKGENNEGVLIWQDKAGTKKDDYKGIYVCKKSGEFDMMVWKPTYEKDKTTLEYAVFYLKYDAVTKTANPIDELHETITFTDEQVTKGGDKYDEASAFVKKLNTYISKSAALIDTVGGDLVYTPSVSEKVSKQYYPKWYDKDYNPDVTAASSSATSSVASTVTSSVDSAVSGTESSSISGTASSVIAPGALEAEAGNASSAESSTDNTSSN